MARRPSAAAEEATHPSTELEQETAALHEHLRQARERWRTVHSQGVELQAQILDSSRRHIRQSRALLERTSKQLASPKR